MAMDSHTRVAVTVVGTIIVGAVVVGFCAGPAIVDERASEPAPTGRVIRGVTPGSVPDVQTETGTVQKTRLRGEPLEYGTRPKGWGPAERDEEVLPGIWLRSHYHERKMRPGDTYVVWMATFENRTGRPQRIRVRPAFVDEALSVVYRPSWLTNELTAVIEPGRRVVMHEATLPPSVEERVAGFIVEVFRE
ncbi:MAG: hypothetical protein BroJett004_08110 [Planctomycetota bacterium]|nr:MAG: hypothetical protein BroJett004_08110 [Planctomycetota bacterium]